MRFALFFFGFFTVGCESESSSFSVTISLGGCLFEELGFVDSVDGMDKVGELRTSESISDVAGVKAVKVDILPRVATSFAAVAHAMDWR